MTYSRPVDDSLLFLYNEKKKALFLLNENVYVKKTDGLNDFQSSIYANIWKDFAAELMNRRKK